MAARVGEAASERGLLARQRQAMLGSLAGIMTHEYNNLMTPVLARAQDALKRDDAAAMRKALTTTVEQTQKALDFTRHVLELAQGRELPITTCRVADLVDAAIASTVRPFRKDGIELVLHVPGDLQIRAQPLLFEQALLNLLLNARTAMEGRCGKLTISASQQGDTIDIAVRDSGEGIPREILDGVINPFLASCDSEHPEQWEAIGLGLLACRTIARQHGATISAYANDGPGCTFRVTWPAA